VAVTIDQLHTQWNIQPGNIHGECFTGYEPIYDQLDKFTTEVYNADPAGTIAAVKALYRSINLVPIDYYTEQGLLDALVDFRNGSYNEVNGGKIGLGNNRGQKINRFMFPNMMTAEPKGRGSNSLKDRFFNDTKLERAIRICFEFRDGNKLVHPTAIRRALELVTGENVQNFKPQNARAIAEHLCPTLLGNVYDYSAGYGGRLLGITSSNMGFKYTAVDPNTETIANLQYLAKLIDTAFSRTVDLHCDVSENFKPTDVDLAFSSPPYFNLEKYCDEPTQCMVQYTTLDEWFEGYVVPTMQNIYAGLNDDGIFATNIADYKSYGNKEYFVVQRWIETAEKIGFKQAGIIKMMLNTRPGVGNNKTEGREKYEGIYVFSK
jgi:hypothetical protein